MDETERIVWRALLILLLCVLCTLFVYICVHDTCRDVYLCCCYKSTLLQSVHQRLLVARQRQRACTQELITTQRGDDAQHADVPSRTVAVDANKRPIKQETILSSKRKRTKRWIQYFVSKFRSRDSSTHTADSSALNYDVIAWITAADTENNLPEDHRPPPFNPDVWVWLVIYN